MNVRLNDQRVELARGQIFPITDGVGGRVTCYRGTVWLTQHYDQRDIVLGAGQSFTLDRDGIALVSALQSSVVALEGPPSPPVASLPTIGAGLVGLFIRAIVRPLPFLSRHSAIRRSIT